MNDEIPKLTKSYNVYQRNCSSHNDCYIGKTEPILHTRTDDHAFSDKENAIYNHIIKSIYSAIFRQFSVSIMIHLIEHFDIIQSKGTSNRLCS